MLHISHYRIGCYRQRMTTYQWKQILLNNEDKVTYRDNVVMLKAKNLGYGVVEVYKDLP